jgi:hypothetical protein
VRRTRLRNYGLTVETDLDTMMAVSELSPCQCLVWIG